MKRQTRFVAFVVGTIVVALFCAAVGTSVRAAEPSKSAEWSTVEKSLLPPTLRDRWFYASFGVGSDEQTENLSALIRRASAAGLDGMLWDCGVEYYFNWDAARKERLATIRAVAEAENVEIIPILWSIGYGTALGFDANFAEGLPVRRLPMKVANGRAEAVLTPVDVPNGSFERWKGDRPLDFTFADEPGTISFRDSDVVRSGDSSIRFENFTANQYGHGRLLQELELEPNCLYRASIWFRTENVLGDLKLDVYDETRGSLTSARLKSSAEKTSDWTQVSATFRAPEEGKTRIYAGVWEGKDGRFWLDDLTVEPLGMINPLRRDGTPIVVSDAAGSAVYEEGKDWILPKFRLQPWNQNSESQTLTIPNGSRISNGETLAVDYYYPPLVGAPQIGTCMSEPKLYEFFQKSARAVDEALAPKKWFLSMDEIRCAGTCRACQERGISLAAILGDCVSKQFEIIRQETPDADVYIWSDMLDPNHNAVNNYYVCEGDYTGVWDLVPKELIISCWYGEKREKSMKFFSERGFRTQAAAYYDADSLDGCVDWLETCGKTPGCVGIMYTTWQNKYDLLEDFGALLDENSWSKGENR